MQARDAKNIKEKRPPPEPVRRKTRVSELDFRRAAVYIMARFYETNTTETLPTMMEFIKRLAKQAGTLALADGMRLQSANIHTKASASDLVTDTDRKVEEFIIGELKRRFPECGVYGEESGRDHSEREYCFVIDPIDGTTSFVRGLPNWCVSIGLARNGKSVAGAVYQPTSGELYYAEEGKGSFLNGMRLRVSEHAELAECVLTTGFSCLRAQFQEETNLKFVARIAPKLTDLRKYGSAALDCCLTARGAVDGFWELNLQPYDIAAGVVIVREAGGVVTDLHGGDGFPGCGFIATNGKIHDKLLEHFRDFRNLRR